MFVAVQQLQRSAFSVLNEISAGATQTGQTGDMMSKSELLLDVPGLHLYPLHLLLEGKPNSMSVSGSLAGPKVREHQSSE